MFNPFNKKNQVIYSPVSGEMVPVSNVSDKVFSSGMMGPGVAFRFDGDTVAAPVDGVIEMIAETKHAFGIKTKEGLEILVHIGLNAVNLKGQGFTVLAAQGSKVVHGTPVLKVDQAFMASHQIDMISPLIITSQKDQLNFEDAPVSVKMGDVIAKK